MNAIDQAFLARTLRRFGVVPVVTVRRAADAAGLADALAAGGLPVVEVTFRTDAAAEALSVVRRAQPEVLLGAGTVLDIATADRAVAAGADFVVSPGFNPAVVDHCLEAEIPVVAGVNSPTDVEMGLARGLRLLKFFPAEPSGGLPMLQAMSAPYRGVEFMPTGGINLRNLPLYLAFPPVAACGGTWIATADAIEAHRFDEITANAREATGVVAGLDRAPGPAP
jgi:2-dehydro-3-deoxyphosphogluconate aldolase/(4S)-4-hydroxy-2-oxoglutarate aldolase